MPYEKLNVYTYAFSWQNKLHSKNLWKTIKRSYFYRSILLSICLPFDIVFLFWRMIFTIRFDCVFITSKWPEIIDFSSEEMMVSSVSPLTCFFSLKNTHYVPASIFYIASAVGVFLPTFLRPAWSDFLILINSKILKRLTHQGSSLVVHSDALPFARSFVMAANKINIKTICIQHGSFRASNRIFEVDGFLCKENIVRSVEDATIISGCNEYTNISIIPEFFYLNLKDRKTKSKGQVLLLGEGYHIIDRDFNALYLNKLEALQNKLQSLDLDFDIVFRPHPSERRMNWGIRFKNVDIRPLEDSLSDTVAVIGYSSTLLQECAEIGIKAYFIDPENSNHIIHGRNSSTIKKLSSIEDFLIEIKNNESDEISLKNMDKRKISFEIVLGIIKGV